jgi:hypothetical protein
MCNRLFGLLIAAMLAFGISGCGGDNTSADPLGTDSLTLSSAAQTNTSGTVIVLTATVKTASGTAVVGREVSFGFVSNTSGATLTASVAKTDSAGEAKILYRAGATTGFDVVRASISNNITSDIVVGGTTAATTTYGISVSATPSSITASGGQSVVQATVVKVDDSLPISGVTVNFSVTPGGGAFGIVTTPSALTDGSGNAITTYIGGTLATGVYTDVVQASFTIGGITYSNAVVITYTVP